MSFEFFLAKRFLVGQRFGVFRIVTTTIAIGGTSIGVAALLVTLAVMDGFRTDIQEKILGTQPHLIVTRPLGAPLQPDPSLAARLASAPHVQGVAPFIYGQALLQSGPSVTGVMLRGILPREESRVTRLHQIRLDGKDALPPRGVLLGQELARAIGAQTRSGLTLTAPHAPDAEGTLFPRARHFEVAGFFRSGMYEYDADLVYVTLADAQDLLGLGRSVSGYGVRLDNLDATSQAVGYLRQELGNNYSIRSWQDLNKNLFSAMKLERTVMFIILTLIILVSSFTIISNLLLLTIEKAREIGILQALGASPRQIGMIFLLNGLLLGGSGVSLGLGLGIGISRLLKRYPLIRLPAEVYYVDRLPIRLSASTVESVAACAFVLVLISILYPAWKASRMDPVPAIRYG